MQKVLLSFLASFILTTYLAGQALPIPPSGDNQKSMVKQYIGSLVSVKVEYSSPDVTGPNGDDRTGKIWGQLVPYGLTDLGFGLRNPSPWRAGANENTVISFSHDVEIGGKELKAGTYGLHLIVNENGPWTWIFSNNSTAWGSYFYDESQDALRVDIESQEAPFREWLTYEFTDRQPESATLTLFWENKAIPMQIKVPQIEELYVAKFRDLLQSSPGFDYNNWATAAQYCVQHDINLEEALTWAETAVSAPFIGQANWNSLQTKAMVLMKLDREDEAMTVLNDAIMHPATTSFQPHQLGRQLIGQGNSELALHVMQKSHEHFNGAWPTNFGMARALSAMGKYEEALKYAKIAHEEAPDQLNKDALAKAIESLGNNEDIN